MLIICDIFNTFCQSFLITWICNNIASRDNKISKFKSCILMSVIFSEILIFTYSGINIPISNFIMAVIILLSIILFYRKFMFDAFVGFGLSYSIIVISAYLLVTFYQNVLIYINFKISTELQMLIYIYIPICLVYFFVYKFRKYIFDFAISLKSLKHSLIFILLIDYALIFMDTLHMEWTTHDMGLIFKSTLYLIAFVAFIFTSIYFAKINDKSKEVEMLNIALSDKITELKKIKHDYGSEISGLYGLYQLGKMDRVGELLKSIVEKSQALNTAINVNVEVNPLVTSVLHSAVSSGIDVIVFDSGNYEGLAMTDNELLKLLSNIIKNSVDVISNVSKPIIKFKSYNSYNGIIITIVNNGPEIPEIIRNRIFESGFSTKENGNGDRGYGLCIVQDIISRCNGKISVESNKEWTQFKIEIPYKIF